MIPRQPGALLHRSLRIYQVWGANTEVGKTVFSTVLCGLCRRYSPGEETTYLKPVSTGPPGDADHLHVGAYLPGLRAETLYQFELPVSPHLAARTSHQATPSDGEVLARIQEFASLHPSPGWLFIETAGGVHSPGPSGTTQADLYRPLRLPAILVGDAKLGGISQTISAFESLKMRGYDVELVLLFRDDAYQNYAYLTDYFQEHHSIPVMTVPLPPPPPPPPSSEDDTNTRDMQTYYDTAMNVPGPADTIPSLLANSHAKRIGRLESMAYTASKTIWYPFTQHRHLTPDRITVIDSAKGSHFQSLIPITDDRSSMSSAWNNLLRPLFDGSASWWTQGLGHGNTRLALSAAYAAGRYGHVMFAEAIHEPGLALAERLLEGMANPRLKRVFYSDNGSTGVEVAVKMALNAARLRYHSCPHEEQEGEKKEEENENEENDEEEKKEEKRKDDDVLGVIGLQGGYHGDTIGAMDCSEPGVFNEKVEWYSRGRRGVWLQGPTVLCEEGRWVVTASHEGTGTTQTIFDSLDDVFDVEAREARGEATAYEDDIRRVLERQRDRGRKLGALIIEPVVLGAGLMQLIDPLFQRTLVKVIRASPHLFAGSKGAQEERSEEKWFDWTGLPIIFDEVFTGIYRLGRFSAASFLGVDPDISVHAKLLTGGLLPLSATLASESIFQSFLSEDKADALLHGHSYTAHAVGCQVALDSLTELHKTAKRPSFSSDSSSSSTATRANGGVWSVWNPDLVEWLSWQQERSVEGVWALGTVLAIHMGTRSQGDSAAGYKSTAAQGLQRAMLRGSGEYGGVGIHSRILGNVLYLIADQTATREVIEGVEGVIRRSL